MKKKSTPRAKSSGKRSRPRILRRRSDNPPENTEEKIPVAQVAVGAAGGSGGGTDDGPPSVEETVAPPHDGPSCRMSLNNLVQLDWSNKSQLFFLHGFGPRDLRRFEYKNREYTVESLDPAATGEPFVHLLPDTPYYLVPIRHEEGTPPDVAYRQLLVRHQDDNLHARIFVVPPSENEIQEDLPLRIMGDTAVLADKNRFPDEYAHLHIIGGTSDNVSTEGIVEAVLTPIRTTPAEPDESLVAPAPTAPSSGTDGTSPSIGEIETKPESAAPPLATSPDAAKLPPSPPPPPAPPDSVIGPEPQSAPTPQPEEPDPDLLKSIDYFNTAKALNEPCAPALAEMQKKFHEHVYHKYDWAVVPITVDQTQFDPAKHVSVLELHVATHADNVILRILQDGYTRQGQPVREAHVAVNKLAASYLNKLTAIRAGRMYFEIQTPLPSVNAKPMALPVLYDEATRHFEIIDALYSALAIFLNGERRKVEEAAEVLRHVLTITTRSLCYDLHAILDATRLPPLRMVHAYRTPVDVGLVMTLTGAERPLQELSIEVAHYAAELEQTIKHGQINAEWFAQRLNNLRSSDISDDTRGILVKGLLELLSRITFGKDLLKGR